MTTPEEAVRGAREGLCDDALSTVRIDGPELRAVITKRITHTAECGSHNPERVALCCAWHACDCGLTRALDSLGNIENRADVIPKMLDAYRDALIVAERARRVGQLEAVQAVRVARKELSMSYTSATAHFALLADIYRDALLTAERARLAARVEALEQHHFERCASIWDEPCNCTTHLDRAAVLALLREAK